MFPKSPTRGTRRRRWIFRLAAMWRDASIQMSRLAAAVAEAILEDLERSGSKLAQ